MIQTPSFVHCNIIEAFRRKKRRASRELCIEHPCIYIELIEESLIQFHGYVSILCVLILCS
jgi:hypothetical protein